MWSWPKDSKTSGSFNGPPVAMHSQTLLVFPPTCSRAEALQRRAWKHHELPRFEVLRPGVKRGSRCAPFKKRKQRSCEPHAEPSKGFPSAKSAAVYQDGAVKEPKARSIEAQQQAGLEILQKRPQRSCNAQVLKGSSLIQENEGHDPISTAKQMKYRRSCWILQSRSWGDGWEEELGQAVSEEIRVLGIFLRLNSWISMYISLVYSLCCPSTTFFVPGKS